MSDVLTMVYLMIPLVAGIFVGYLARDKKKIKLDKASVAIIVLLIFCVGFSISSSNELLAAMPTVGLQALLICVLAVAFSIAFVVVGRKLVKV
jgi:uncharacterized membrane protein YbjE (DUF340 family)